MGIIKYEGIGWKCKVIYCGCIVLMLVIDVYFCLIFGYLYYIVKNFGENVDLVVECFKNVLMLKLDWWYLMYGKFMIVVSDGSIVVIGD